MYKEPPQINKKKIDKSSVSGTDSEIFEEYNFLFDNAMSPYDKMAKYIMKNEPEDVYITGEEIKRIIEEQ